jgi:hypothetical protein
VRAHLLALAGAVALAGCIPEEGPMMAPGEDCLSCHGGSGGEEDARAWTVAGTLRGSEGSRVTVIDTNGRAITMRANQAGNFYTAEGLALPLTQVWLDGKRITDSDMWRVPTFTHGSCNRPTNGSSCHARGRNGGD